MNLIAVLVLGSAVVASLILARRQRARNVAGDATRQTRWRSAFIRASS